VITAIALSVVLSVGATLALTTVLGTTPDDGLPEASPPPDRDEAPPASGTATDPRFDALQAAVAAGATERARLRQTIERQAGEIDALRRTLAEARAGLAAAPEPDPETRTLEALAALAAGKPGGGQAAIHIAVRDLVQLGEAAVPAVVAALASGSNRSYGGGCSISGGSVTSYPDSRMALIDVLRQIGTPSAQRELLRVVATGHRLGDYGHLFLLCHSTEDAQMIRGMSAMVPDVFRQVATHGADREVPFLLERYLSDWVQRHAVTGAVSELAKQVEANVDDDSFRGYFASALVAMAPDQAAMLAARLAAREDGEKSVVRFTRRATLRQVPLGTVTRFYEHLFSRVSLTPEARMSLYASIPTRPPREVKGAAARAADAKSLLTFLEARLARETEPKVRRVLESSLKRLKKSSAREEKRARR
jgi:hypothetical protein